MLPEIAANAKRTMSAAKRLRGKDGKFVSKASILLHFVRYS